jgi:hypothetical protein
VRFDLALDLERREKMGEKWDNGIMLRKWDNRFVRFFIYYLLLLLLFFFGVDFFVTRNLLLNRIRPDLEFRCFVSKKKISAISQYDPVGYFPHVVKHQEAIKDNIFTFYNDVIKYLAFKNFNVFEIRFLFFLFVLFVLFFFDHERPRVPLEDYVIDLGIIPSEQQYSSSI